MAEGDINPWVRADLERPNAETQALIPEYEQEHYLFILSEIGRTGLLLGEAHGAVYKAQADFNAAWEARAEFYRTKRHI